MVALAAEFAISFGLFWLMLEALHSVRLKPLAGWLVGALLAAYVIWEAPLSGMSLNPFRTLSAAVAADDYTALWVYFLGPLAAVWLAAVLFQQWRLRPRLPPATAPPCYPDPSA